MEKRVNEKLIQFLLTHKDNLEEDLIQYIEDNMEAFLNGDKTIDILAQVAHAIGEKPKTEGIYDQYFEFLKNNFGLEQDILEVGCGYYPAFADMIDEHQRKQGKGSIEAYDPRLLITERGNIKLHRCMFEKLENDNITLVTSIFPCEGTLTIIDEASAHDIDYSILMCECIPEEVVYSMPFGVSPDFWLNLAYHTAQNLAPSNREIGIEHIEKVDTPIIFSKRKR